MSGERAIYAPSDETIANAINQGAGGPAAMYIAARQCHEMERIANALEVIIEMAKAERERNTEQVLPSTGEANAESLR